MLASARETAVGAVAGIPIIHALADGIQIESGATIEWSGTSVSSDPVVIRHEVGNALPVGMRSVLEVPPWCTFHLDSRGEPASLFHAVFGEVDRLLSCEEPGASYIVRYAERPREPVVALQSELTAYSFALSARGVGLIAHSCAFVAPNGTGVLCPGVSGTGKTTLARLLQRHVPEITVLTDDRAVVTRGADGLALWGSPWPGAARIASGKSASLATIVFIRHGRFCAVRPVTAREAFRRIVNTLSMPLWEPARCGSALEIVDALVSRSRLVELTYPPTEAGARWVVEVVQRAEPLGGRDQRG